MMQLKRVAVNKDGAFGVLVDGIYPFCVTLEHTYDDQKNLVKIPPGVYNCTRTRYHKGGYDTFEIHVPGHTRILFHIGNVESDSDGCILLGESFDPTLKGYGITRSGDAFKEFMKRTQSVDTFDLKVVSCG